MSTSWAGSVGANPHPQISLREEEQERMALSEREVAGIEVDTLGLTSQFERAMIDDQTTKALLSQLDDELENLPYAEKSAYMMANRKDPRMVGDKCRSAFLWREDYDAKRAAQRLVRYWDYRKELFGEEKCYLPLTLAGALRDDIGAFMLGTVYAIPEKDLSGRPIMFFDMSRDDPSKCSRESLLRVYWYMFEALCEDEDARRKGIVVISFCKNILFEKFDHSIRKTFMQLETSYLPVKIRSIHTCQPPQFFHVTSPTLKYNLGKHHRERFIVHYGSDEYVVQELAKHRILPNRVPSDMGGSLTLNMEQWLRSRQRKEEEMQSDFSGGERITQMSSPRSFSSSSSSSVSETALDSILDARDTDAKTQSPSGEVLEPEASEIEDERSLMRTKDREWRRQELLCDGSEVRITDFTPSPDLVSETPLDSILDALDANAQTQSPSVGVFEPEPSEVEDEMALKRMIDRELHREDLLFDDSEVSVSDSVPIPASVTEPALDSILDALNPDAEPQSPSVGVLELGASHADDEGSLNRVKDQEWRRKRLPHDGSVTDREVHKEDLLFGGSEVRIADSAPIPASVTEPALDSILNALDPDAEPQSPSVSVLELGASHAGGERSLNRVEDREWRREDLSHDVSEVRITDSTPTQASVTTKKKPGRGGDSRMTKALEEKLKNPDMTLLEALEKGGFTFDFQFDKPNMNDSKVFGADNISLRQRKNQLSRRIKKAAQK